jgi:hypothetical protein
VESCKLVSMLADHYASIIANREHCRGYGVWPQRQGCQRWYGILVSAASLPTNWEVALQRKGRREQSR